LEYLQSEKRNVNLQLFKDLARVARPQPAPAPQRAAEREAHPVVAQQQQEIFICS